MDKKQQLLFAARQQAMAHRRVLCTGNPDDPTTLASGVRKLYPDATFIHRSTGWDLTDMSDAAVERLKAIFAQHNTFINASYIAPGVQQKLLEICSQSVKFCDVVNIGSTNEYDGLGSAEYSQSKISLRECSLKLNTFRFKTHHIVLGGINKTQDPTTADWLTIDTICSTIPWILAQPFNVPILAVDQFKAPW